MHSTSSPHRQPMFETFFHLIRRPLQRVRNGRHKRRIRRLSYNKAMPNKFDFDFTVSV